MGLALIRNSVLVAWNVTKRKRFLGLGVERVRKATRYGFFAVHIHLSSCRQLLNPSSFTVVGDCCIRGFIHGFIHGAMLDDCWGVTKNIGPIKIMRGPGIEDMVSDISQYLVSCTKSWCKIFWI